MRRLLSIFGAFAVLALVAGLAAGPARLRSVCFAAGICSSDALVGAMLASVQRQQKLVVLEARLVEPVTSVRVTTLGPIDVAKTRETAILGATVTYSVDLAQLKQGDLDWDAPNQTLRIRRPAVNVGTPNIDWANAQFYSDEGWATAVTDVRENLRRDNAEKAPARFKQQAATPDLLAMADSAAQIALEQAFRLPLVAAGFAEAKVIVTKA